MAEYRASLRVHKADCVRCGYLVDFATERFDPCHFSKGNEDCPAKVLVVTIGFDQGQLIELIAVAQQNQNWTDLASLMTQLNALPEDQRQAVLAELDRRKASLTPDNGPDSGPARPAQRVAGRS